MIKEIKIRVTNGFYSNLVHRSTFKETDNRYDFAESSFVIRSREQQNINISNQN